MDEEERKSEEEPEDNPTDYDDILVMIGEFGTYQKLLYILLLAGAVLSSMVYTAIVFIEDTPTFRCMLPDLQNDTFEIQGEWHQRMVDISFMNVTDDECTVFHNISRQVNVGQDGTEPEKCTEWVYDTTYITYSYPMQFSLVCDSKSKLTTSHIINVLGVLIAGVLSGAIADIAGRRMGLLLGLGLGGLAGIGWAFASSYILGLVLRFFYGLGFGGVYCLSSTLTLEMVGPNRRVMTGTGLALMFAGGGVVATGMAYFLRDWRHLQTAVSVPYLLLTILMFWAILDLMYFGINLHAGNMAGNMYLNIFLFSLVEFPAYAFCFTIDIFGRKKPYITCTALGGLACLSSLFVKKYADNELESTNYIKVGLSTVGKFGVAAAYNILYIWSIEVFPTVLRNFSMGLALVSAGVGGMLAPVIVRDINVESIGKDTLPLVIFGILALFGAACTLPVPETARTDLPVTVADADTFKKYGCSTMN
ncbi:solute carrier family 22 member 13-like [Lingula anatina]|uniref:Solute carrier family 22 member 13-like n=1 Tax=Lingula anatina TaxID=7574 RepID=A0A2R2MRG3_LINAN|nr:solute carrier family 22 member 13-like [Lingula anatina]|eukprot:XP_023932835.1 solute carrier family 22 member 13-like [Lingula anatina]